MDFDTVPNLEIDGYRIAPIDQFDGRLCGDAYLIHSDGTSVDLAWESEALLPRCEKRASTIEGGNGVWQVGVVEEVNEPADLDVVLQAVVDAIAGRTPETPRCSRCGSSDPIPIAYGFPGPEMMEAVERGDIVLGGCCIEEYQAEWRCRGCGNEFPKLDASDWDFPLKEEDWTDDDFDAWERADIAEEADRVRLAEVIAEADAAGVDRTDAGIDAFEPERRRVYLLEAIRRHRERSS